MPKVEIDYSSTIIYKITCKDPSVTDVFVSYTTNFIQRKSNHKRICTSNKSTTHDAKLYEKIRANGGWNNWRMEIINKFECKDQYEARLKEQEYILLSKASLNSTEPLIKQKLGLIKEEDKPVVVSQDINNLTAMVLELQKSNTELHQLVNELMKNKV